MPEQLPPEDDITPDSLIEPAGIGGAAFAGFRPPRASLMLDMVTGAVVREEDGTPPPRANFTLVPNEYFYEIMRREKLCVIKVVGLIISKTLGWHDDDGRLHHQATVSYADFMREMGMSRQSVVEGLTIAMARGYIVRVQTGALRDHHNAPESASYALHWAASGTFPPSPTE